MRRSFGGASTSGSKSGMGGGNGGGSVQMLRSVQRAVRASASQEPFPHSNSTNSPAKNSTTTSASRRARARQTTSAITGGGTRSNILTLSSSSTSTSSPFNNNFPVSASSPAWPSSPTFSDESSDWVCVDGFEDNKAQVFYDDFVFGAVPSKDEVHHAVIALQEVLDPGSPKYLAKDGSSHKLTADAADQVTSPTGSMQIASPFGLKLDWMEPPHQLWSSNMLQRPGYERVNDAFNMLRNEPSVQRMVMSLSSDRAVWDAVLNNEVVQELRETFNSAGDTCPSEKSEDGDHDASDVANNFLNWIVNTKAKVMEFIEQITKLVNDFFHAEEDAKTADKRADPFEEKLRASFFLTVVVMLIVVMTRTKA